MKGREHPVEGLTIVGGGKGRKIGWCEGHEEPGDLPDFLADLEANRFTLFYRDRYLAIAREDSIVVVATEVLALARDARSAEAIEPIARVDTPSPLTHLVARGPRRPLELLAVDEAGAVRAYDFRYRGPRRAYSPIATEPRARLIGEGLDGEIEAVIPTRSRIVVHMAVEEANVLHLLDGKTTRTVRRVELPVPGRVLLSALHPSKADTLIAVGPSQEVELVHLPDSMRTTVEVEGLETPRVTAVALVSGRYLVAAQKGGLVSKIDVTTTHATMSRDPWGRACRILRLILERCGCGCHEPETPGKPGEGRDPDLPGGLVDDEPCGERHEWKLAWTVRALACKGSHLVAFSADNKRMAIFDQKLNLLSERFIGRRGALVASGESNAQRMLLYRRTGEKRTAKERSGGKAKRGVLEAWSVAEYVATLKGFEPGSELEPLVPEPASKVVYYGQREAPAAPNPTLSVCVFTVVEPGQAFTDPDQSKLAAQIEPNVFDVVNDYYDEASFGDLDVQFSVFGHDFDGTRTPLVLPQPAADYFWELFTPGGLKAVMPADWADPVVLDGTESLDIRTDPRVGDDKDYTVPFAALWTAKNHLAYPVDIEFDGSETLQLTVEDQEGETHVLDLDFDALSLDLDEGEDEQDFLDAVGAHVTAAIRAAENALPDSPTTIQDVVFRRIRTSDDDDEFGILQGQFRVASAGGSATQKGTIEITNVPSPAPAGLDALGLAGSGSSDGVLESSLQTSSYFRHCLRAARTDAGQGPGLNDQHFNDSVTVDEDAAAQEITVQIRLTSQKGGQGADISVIGHDGLAGTGWDVATPVPGSESTSNNQSALRYSAQLADDVFTAALDHIRATTGWNADTARAMFADFDVMMIGFVGSPPAGLPTADQWGSVDPNDFGRLRMFRRTHFATDQNNPDPADTPVAMGTSVVIGQKFNTFRPGLMAHELGHALSLPDLYSATGYRDDVLYIGSWGMMAGGNENLNHFCAWSKWALGWLEESSDDDLNRVIEVPMPVPDDVTRTEAWLVPVEHWDSSLKADVRAVVGGSVPIVQMMKVHLGSDGGVLSFLELRAPGANFSQNLPGAPAVIATNGLDPETDRRWAVNGLYRRNLHRLNQGNELMNVGDKWDFAAAVEFPLKGCTVEVMDIETVRGSIPVFRLEVLREEAEFIDLYFEDNVPSWRSPDLWIDWPGDNPDPDVPFVYPLGSPTDQGENVRFPASGIEKHYLVARVHNGGEVHAEDVKVKWFICDPPGAGDDGKWVEKDAQTIPVVNEEDVEITPFTWNVDPSTNSHQCLRAEIIDWTIPSEVDPATGDTLHLASDDVILQNNNAQQNVFDFEALGGSPYQPIEFAFQVHNDAVESEWASLVPDRLPWGYTLEVSPAEARIDSGKARIFHCKLTIDESVVRPGCDNDSGFLLTAWRRAEDSDEKWGSCFYFVRPRYETELTLTDGYWLHSRLTVNGRLDVVTGDPVDLSDQPQRFVRIRVRLDKGGGDEVTFWRTAPVAADGTFALSVEDGIVESGAEARVQAWFDRTDRLGSSTSNELPLKHQFLE